MNKPAVIQLRLPRSVKNGVERWAKLDGTSMNQLIASAVAEKLSALETAEFFEERARRADFAAADRIMNRAGGEPPRIDDEMPRGTCVAGTRQRIEYCVPGLPMPLDSAPSRA